MDMYLRIGKSFIKYLFSVSISIQSTLLVSAAQNNVSHQAPMSGDIAPGVILIDISDPKHYWQYEVQPHAGSVRLLKEQALRHNSSDIIPKTFQQPAGAIQSCTTALRATSPDGNYIAECGVLLKKDHAPRQDQFILTKVGSSSSNPWEPDGWRAIKGFAWATNSRSVAVLSYSEHYGKDPVGILSGSMGHPIPHSTVFLDVIDVQTGSVTEYLLRENVTYAFTRILRWSE